MEMRIPFQIFRVGGSVRDELLGLTPKDRDYVVVGATEDALIQAGFRRVGKDFPVFLHPETGEEYALARREIKVGRGYKGFAVQATPDVTLKEDLARRDLTINAMARDSLGDLIDPFGGRQDLEKKILRYVGIAFREDPLRVLRTARFAGQFGFDVHPDTLALMMSIVQSGEIRDLTPERLWAEIGRGLDTSEPSRFLRVLRDSGALDVLFPELSGQPDREFERLGRSLDAAARQHMGLAERFSVLTAFFVGDDPVGPVSDRFPIPKTVLKLAHQCVDLCGPITNLSGQAPDAIYDLLKRAGAVSHPEDLDPVLDVCEILASGGKDNGAAFSKVRRFLSLILEGLSSLDFSSIARSERGGAQIQDAIRKACIAKISELLSSAKSTNP